MKYNLWLCIFFRTFSFCKVSYTCNSTWIIWDSLSFVWSHDSATAFHISFFKLGHHDFNLLCPVWCLIHSVISHKIPPELLLLHDTARHYANMVATFGLFVIVFLVIAVSTAEAYFVFSYSCICVVENDWCHVQEDWYGVPSKHLFGGRGYPYPWLIHPPHPLLEPPENNLKIIIAKLKKWKL